MPKGLEDRKSTRLNSSHLRISYAVFCLKKKKNTEYAITGHPTSRSWQLMNIHRETYRLVGWLLLIDSLREPVNVSLLFLFFFFKDTATTEIYTFPLPDPLPI